jgi:phage shock protein PspC (stress-responsive transcriptional regulator)
MEKKLGGTPLFRIKNRQAMLGGVSQGLSEYFNMDVTLIRVVFVLLFFTPVPALFAYFILWVILPVKYEYGLAGVGNSKAFNLTNDISQNSKFTYMSSHNQKNNLVGGAVLIILGIIFSFKTFFHINLFRYIGQMWPLILIGIGVWLIVKDRKDDNFTNNDSSSNL